MKCQSEIIKKEGSWLILRHFFWRRYENYEALQAGIRMQDLRNTKK
jgi:hypothetical protein